MEKKLFFALVIVCSTTHIIRFFYEILKHKQLIKPGKLSFAIIFVNMMLLWISWFLLCRYDIYNVTLPGVIKYFGMFLSLIGLVLFLTGLSTMKTLENFEGDLITKGIYSKIRHPMYLGFILWLIGFPVYFGAIFSIFLALLFIANILFWRFLEEKELEQRFSGYKDYRKTTIF
jgi:protein-S-isoprenylcysteine O-methyltransferase Ste14